MKLAETFEQLETVQRRADQVARGILDFIRERNVEDLEEFDALVQEAYDARGWNYAIGRPPAGVEIRPVPPIIRTYVGEARGAYRLGLDVGSFRTWHQLRKAVREARAAQEPAPPPERTDRELPQLQGLRVLAEDKLIGAPFHDLIVVYEALHEDKRKKLEQSIRRLLNRFRKEVEEPLQEAA